MASMNINACEYKSILKLEDDGEIDHVITLPFQRAQQVHNGGDNTSQ